MSRLILLVPIMALLLSILSLSVACDEDEIGDIIDDLGRTVSIDGVPDRIVSLAPSCTEILFALGLGDKIVGVTEYCDYPEEAMDKNHVGGFSTVDLEKVVAVNPDLILATAIHEEETIPALEKLGLTVVALVPDNMQSMLDNIRLVGDITDAEGEAKDLVSDLQHRIDAVTDEVGGLSQDEKPRVLYITWHEPIWTVGKGSTTHELIELAGGINIADDIERHGTIDLESVVARNPNVIIAGEGHGSAEEGPVNWAKTNETLSTLDARIDDRIYRVDADIATRGGPRMVEGLESFANFIHPDLFGAPE